MKKLDITRRFSQAWSLLEEKKTFKKLLSLAVVLGAYVLKEHFDFTLMGTLTLIFFGLAMLWRISSRVSALFALAFLANCPLLLILGKEGLAEIAAVQAYYLLVVTVVLQIVELNSKKGEGELPDMDGLLAKIARHMSRISIGLQKIGNKLSSNVLQEKQKESSGKKLVKEKVEKNIHSRRRFELSRRSIVYILLLSFLTLEAVVVFFDWSLLGSIFGYLFIVAVFFPKKLWKIFFAGSIILALLSLFALVFLEEKQAGGTYFWLLVSCFLTLWTWTIKALKKR